MLKSEHIIWQRKVRRSARASVSSSFSRRAQGERQKKQEADTRAERRAGDDKEREEAAGQRLTRGLSLEETNRQNKA